MLSVKEAEKIILDLVKPIEEESIVDLEDSRHRILATDITSNLDFPYWDNSAMDGYAVKYADVENSSLNNPVSLNIIEEIPAGYTPKLKIKSGQAARIFTGAMLPVGADTIVMQENTRKEDNIVKILVAPKPQQFVRHKGSFYKAGDNLLTSGIEIDSPEMAILATAQCTEFPVFDEPKVAFFSTGNELITPYDTLKSGQIIDSNSYFLNSFIQQNNCWPYEMDIVKDEKGELFSTILEAMHRTKCIISTGGVSVGDYDYIDEVLAKLGGKIHFRSVAIKPGKPLTFATLGDDCLYFGIPGNPVSTMVCCWRFVQSALQKLRGVKSNYQPIFVEAKTRQDLYSGGKRETYLWGKLYLVNGRYEFDLANGLHNSANLINFAQTNGLAVIPVGQKIINAQNKVQVMVVNKPIINEHLLRK